MTNDLTWVACYVTYIDVHRLTITVELDPIEQTWGWNADWLNGDYYGAPPFATAEAAQADAATWYHEQFLPKHSTPVT